MTFGCFRDFSQEMDFLTLMLTRVDEKEDPGPQISIRIDLSFHEYDRGIEAYIHALSLLA